MKKWVVGAFTVGLLMAGGAAFACPVGENSQPPKRPLQNASFQASALVERAGRLESIAASHERSARALEGEASSLAGRARLLRKQAATVNVADRPSLVALADDLSLRAEGDRSRAAADRASAAEFRLEARGLRERAAQLVRPFGGRDGWRGRVARPANDVPRFDPNSV